MHCQDGSAKRRWSGDGRWRPRPRPRPRCRLRKAERALHTVPSHALRPDRAGGVLTSIKANPLQQVDTDIHGETTSHQEVPDERADRQPPPSPGSAQADDPRAARRSVAGRPQDALPSRPRPRRGHRDLGARVRADGRRHARGRDQAHVRAARRRLPGHPGAAPHRRRPAGSPGSHLPRREPGDSRPGRGVPGAACRAARHGSGHPDRRAGDAPGRRCRPGWSSWTVTTSARSSWCSRSSRRPASPPPPR